MSALCSLFNYCLGFTRSNERKNFECNLRGKREESVWADHENMAILESCCGSGLAVSSAVIGVYLLIAYIIGFAIELWWIHESPATPPIPAYLLCAAYFVLVVFSALLLHGLSTKRISFLLVWLFMMGILLGPEAGLVLYLSIHYWRVTSLYGLIEVTCWACRLVVNATGLLCVQSLHSIWREEKSLLSTLETLNNFPNPKTTTAAKPQPPSLDDSPRNRLQQKPNSTDPFASPLCDPITKTPSPFTQFHASSFDPAVIDARLEAMPYLTIRHRGVGAVRGVDEGARVVRARSLMELRGVEGDRGEEEVCEVEDGRESVDGKIIKNKNLKILKGLSPFNRRKAMEVNIYRINPPRESNWSNVDVRLKEIYANRGMYMIDEKLGKVVYYPAEVFRDSVKFRKRMDSYGSSQSRSSVDTDSEDIRHISDVAL